MSDVTSIAALATAQAKQNDSVAINTLVEKRALDAQKTMAQGLIEAIPPAPTGSLGHSVNTFA
ncbi:MAG TPA: YjfB family protein [Herbaspirillum sp.]|jgi:hypothetical protein